MDSSRLCADSNLFHSVQFTASLCNLCQDLQLDPRGCVRRLHAGLLRHGRKRRRRGLRDRLCLYSLDRFILVWPADHLWLGMQHRLDSVVGMGVRLWLQLGLGRLWPWLALSARPMVGSLLGLGSLWLARSLSLGGQGLGQHLG